MRRIAAGTLLLLTSLLVAQDRSPFTLIERMSPTASSQVGAKVEVIDPDWEPIAGASVAFVTSDAMRDPKTKQFRTTINKFNSGEMNLYMALASRYGQRFVSGTDGTVTIPNDKRGYLVATWLNDGKRFAAMKLMRKETQDVEIEVRALKDILVRVIDERGRPVSGMPVAASRRNFSLFGFDGQAAAWTNRKGIAYVNTEWNIEYDSMTVGVAIAGAQSVTKTLDLKNGIPEEIVTLQMPPFGQIKTIVYNNDGKPSDQVSGAAIRIDNRFQRGGNYQAWTAPIIDSDGVTFPAVRLNQEVTITHYLMGSAREVIILGAGPKLSREMTILAPSATEIAATATNTISCRILDKSGEPVKSEIMGIAFVNSTNTNFFSSRTDKNGRLNFSLPTKFHEGGELSTYVMRRKRGSNGSPLGGVSIAIPTDRPQRSLDLGDQRLEQEPVRLAGTIMDDKGQPLMGAEVTVDSWFHRRSRSRSGALKFFRAKVSSDAEGRFEIRHIFNEMRDLDVTIDGYYLENSPAWEVGDTNVKMALSRSGKVVASLLDPPKQYLLLTLTNDSDPELTWTSFCQGPRDKNEVTWNVPPGTYTLFFGRAAVKDIIAEGIQTKAGETVNDARLTAINWKKHYREISVSVTDEQGNRIPDATITFYTTGQGLGWSGTTSIVPEAQESVKTLINKKVTLLVVIEADGYATHAVYDVKQDLKTVLTKYEQLKITLDKALKIPDDMRLGIRLIQDSKKLQQIRTLPFDLQETDTELFVDGTAQPYIERGHDCTIELTLIRTKQADQYKPQTVSIPHDFANIEVTDKTIQTGVKLVVDSNLILEIEDAIDNLRNG